jgi:2-methylcitrate dehydratase PrpD
MTSIAAAIPGASAIDALAEFASTASGAAHRDRISLHIADAVIALLAGRDCPEGKAIVDFFARTERSPLAMISANAAAMRLSEIDDIHRPSAVTASAIAFPAALGMATLASAKLTSITPQRFADAIFVGQAVSIRLAMALGGVGLMARGMWPSYLVAPFGAAATAARMLNLTPERTRHALALALAQTPHAVGRSIGSRPGRWLLFGIDGDPGLLDSAWLQTVGGPASDIGLLTPVDGISAAIRQLSIKPHCAAKQTLAAIYGLQRLIAEGLDPATIDSLDLFVPTAYAGMIDREPASASRLASILSAPWQLALTALRPALLDDVARDSLPEDVALDVFAGKVKIHADVALDKKYPQSWPARLLVRMGTVSHEILVEDSPGDPDLSCDIDDINNKARRILRDHAAITLVTQGADVPSDARALNVLCRYFGDTDA